MRRLEQMGAKALRLQMKKYPNKRFKDDDGKMVSFSDLADQIEAILAVEFPFPMTEFHVQQKGKNCWIVTRK